MASVSELLPIAVRHHQAGQWAEAERLYRRILAIEPRNADALHLTGVLAQQVGRHETAIRFIVEAIRVMPGVAVFHANLGEALRSVGRNEEAIASYRQALLLDASNPAPNVRIGHVLKNLGRADEAIDAYKTAMRQDPDLAGAYAGLGHLAAEGLYELSDAEVERMHRLLESRATTTADAASLRFALADRSHRQGDYDRAFDHYRGANRLQRQAAQGTPREFDLTRHASKIDRIIETFDSDYFARVRSFGVSTSLPVFVVGMPRSGTTLVEQILASHRDVVGGGELKHVSELAVDLPKIVGSTTLRFPEAASLLTDDTAEKLAGRYLSRIESESDRRTRFVDKMPANYSYLGLIATMLPDATVVCCLRDAMDVCLSCYCTSLKDDYTSSLEDLGAYYRQFQRLMGHWRETLPIRILDVRYEELIEDQEKVTRRLLRHCGLDWDENCLSFHENPRAVKTASKFQVRQPLYDSSVRRWKRYGRHLEPLRRALGDPD